jgi:hypothetical protein
VPPLEAGLFEIVNRRKAMCLIDNAHELSAIDYKRCSKLMQKVATALEELLPMLAKFPGRSGKTYYLEKCLYTLDPVRYWDLMPKDKLDAELAKNEERRILNGRRAHKELPSPNNV